MVARLDLLAEVTVLAELTPTKRLIGRDNRWYRVRTDDGTEGALFGALLTPVGGTADLDGDGESERYALTFSPRHNPQIRLAEPQRTDESEQVLDLPVGVGWGGAASVAVVEREGGRALQVSLCRERAGGERSCEEETVVLYRAEGPGRAGHLSLVIAEEVIAAYVDSCAHVFTEADEYIEEPQDECLFREFDQMCAPDHFGCWGAEEECSANCGKPCVSCQRACTDDCESCRDRCAEDAACVRRCASDRAGCRQMCLEGLSACRSVDCAKVAAACDKEATEQLKRTCPDCEALGACVAQGSFDDIGKLLRDCARKFPANGPECETWCVSFQ